MRKSIIDLQNVSYSIPYGDSILENMSFSLRPGEFLGILGHNGTGKTTLLDIILGNKLISHGKIIVMDEDPHGIDRHNKQFISYLSQDVSVKGNVTIEDFLKFHSAFYPNYSKEDEQHLLEVFDLKSDMKIGALSTGQQKKVQITAAFSTRPELILIDEITAVLDPETRDIFFRELLKIRNKYSTSILLATNIAEDLIGRADKILFIENKKISEYAPTEIPNLFNLKKVA